MSTPSLLSALARLRQQAVGGTTGTTSALGSGSTPAGEKPQQPQGFEEGGTTGTSGTIENVARLNFPPSTPAEAAALREWHAAVVPVVPVVPGQQRRGFEAEPPADALVVPVVPPAAPKPPAWTDDLAWCARLGAAGDLHARRAVLRAWVDTAGGWHDAAAIYLPASLPRGLVLATIKAHGRALRLDVRNDPDDPAHFRWLRGEPDCNPAPGASDAD